MPQPPDLPRALFGFPGELRDRLVAAILDGTKTSTSSLLVEYELDDEPFPRPGDRSVVVDSQDRPVAVIELTEVRVVPVSEIDLDFVRAEGEGDETVADWLRGHTEFWQSEAMREALGRPDFAVTSTTQVVAERFRVIEVL